MFPHQLLSDCENDPPEWTVLYEVAQSFSRFSQREGLSYDRFDRAGFKQRGNRFQAPATIASG